MVLCKVLCLAFVFSSVNCAVLPVEKCKLDDSACLKSEFQKAIPVFMGGIPDAGIDVLDLMEMNVVKFDLAGLQFTLNDGRLKGLKNSVIDDVKWDVKKKLFTVDYHMDVFLKGHYTAAGRILILPITGDGQMKLKLKNLQVKFIISYEMVKGADGKDHVKPTKYSFEFEVKDNAHYHLTNLFNGNKELSDAMLTFLNQNWKQVTSEFGRPIIDVAAQKIFKNIKIYFEKNPIGDIATL